MNIGTEINTARGRKAAGFIRYESAGRRDFGGRSGTMSVRRRAEWQICLVRLRCFITDNGDHERKQTCGWINT